MNKRFFTFLLAIFGVLIVGIIVMVVVLLIKKPVTNDGVDMGNINNEDKEYDIIYTNTNTDNTSNVNSLDAGQTTNSSAQNAQALARSFVERYGSFSNQNHYENLINLEIFMTESLWRWAEGVIAEGENSKKAGDDYYGIVTKVISVNFLEESEKEIKFSLACQRRETDSLTNESNIFFQDIALTVVSDSNDTWKVDSVTWQ